MNNEEVLEEVKKLKKLAFNINENGVTQTVVLESFADGKLVRVTQTAFRDMDFGPIKFSYEVEVTV